MRPPLKSQEYHILDKKINELERLYRTDMTLVQIAGYLNVGERTLKQKIQELGWKRSARYRRKVIDRSELEDLLNSGISDGAICDKLRIGRRVLSRHKKEIGIYIEDKGKIFQGKRGSAYREYYKKTGTRPKCPNHTNILGKYKDEIIFLLEKGIRKTEIAKKYRVSLATVFNFLHLYEIHVPIKKVCDNKDDLILKSFQSGKSLEDISRKVPCCPATIYHKIKGMDLSRSKKIVVKKSFLNSKRNLINKLYQQGLSGREIAEKLNVSSHAIYQFIRRFKLTRPQRITEYHSTFKGHDEALLQMRQNGMTLKQIGEYFEVNGSTVFYRLKKLEGADA